MNELYLLKNINKCIKSFTYSQFCPYIDTDLEFPYSGFSKFFLSLFNNSFNDEIESFVNEKSSSEHTADIYLSKIVNLPNYLFLFLYNFSLKDENQSNIHRLENMNFDEKYVFFESCKKNYTSVVKQLLENGFNVNETNNEHEYPIHVASIN